jgi:alpha-N-acetylglucosaminidase
LNLRIITRIIIILLFALDANTTQAQLDLAAAKSVLNRIIPAHAPQFTIEEIKRENGKDVFEIETRNNQIILRGNNGISIASALYYYLNEYCHAQITWNGTNLNLPKILPKTQGKIHKNSPYEYRYYMNYCTFNYSMSWWNWERWEKKSTGWRSMESICH